MKNNFRGHKVNSWYMHVELRIGFGPGEIVSYTRVRNIQIKNFFFGFLASSKIYR